MRLMMTLKFKEDYNIMEKPKKVGRPKLNIDKITLSTEIQKYLNGEQKAVTTYRNLGIGKTSFYRILEKMEVHK